MNPTLDAKLAQKVESVLLTLLEATEMEGVKAWALQIAFTYARECAPSANPKELWKFIESVYEGRLRDVFPAQVDPAQSFKRASGDAFEVFVQEYLNSNPRLQEEGIRAVRLRGQDFRNLVNRRNLRHAMSGRPLSPKDVDIFLQGIDANATIHIFGAVFPKVSYAERIRADEGASRALMSTRLWSGTVTLDARGELGTEERPSIKRDTINKGAFDGCYSFNRETTPGGRIHVVDPREKGLRNPLIHDVVHAWRRFQASTS